MYADSNDVIAKEVRISILRSQTSALIYLLRFERSEYINRSHIYNRYTEAEGMNVNMTVELH